MRDTLIQQDCEGRSVCTTFVFFAQGFRRRSVGPARTCIDFLRNLPQLLIVYAQKDRGSVRHERYGSKNSFARDANT